MTPLEIYALFVLPAVLIAISGGFVFYGRTQIQKRKAVAEKLETEQKVQAMTRVQRRHPLKLAS